FSSRRRHTRFSRDWSSDVCSSDLPFEGKVAVAEVVLNRLRSRHFPNTLEEVIRQPGQFEPVMSGRYDEILNSQRDLTEELRAVQIGRASCRERVEIAAAGVL